MVKFTISKKKVLSQFEIVSNVSDIVSFSSKTNPLVSSILEDNTSCMFSIHLENELKNVKDKKRVMFLAQGWDASKVKQLIDSGITWFVVDNKSDLEVLENFDLDSLNVLLRVKLKENSIRTERYFVFGMDSSLVEQKILSGKFAGIHFHRKSQNMSEWNIQFELENMFSTEAISAMKYICIGGGMPSEYANTNKKVISNVIDKIQEFKSYCNNKNIKMITEPGRFIAAPSGKLHCTIISVYDNNVIVNASVYNSDMDALIVPVKLLIENEKEEGTAYVIKGLTPCSMDLFRYRAYLDNVEVGSSLTFLNAGAYNFSTDFCDLEKIKTEVVE